MLWVGNKKMGQIWIGSKPVQALYRGSVLIWEAVSSCFGSGFWREKLPWKGTDSWRND